MEMIWKMEDVFVAQTFFSGTQYLGVPARTLAHERRFHEERLRFWSPSVSSQHDDRTPLGLQEIERSRLDAKLHHQPTF